MEKNAKGRLNKLIGNKISQNLRMVEVRRGLWRSFGPITAQAGPPLAVGGGPCVLVF